MNEWIKALLGVACIATPVAITATYAKPLAVATHGVITITLHDEPCKLKIQLPSRATWVEGRKTYEGCWGAQGELVVTYFDDQSIAVLPVTVFRPVTTL